MKLKSPLSCSGLRMGEMFGTGGAALTKTLPSNGLSTAAMDGSVGDLGEKSAVGNVHGHCIQALIPSP